MLIIDIFDAFDAIFLARPVRLHYDIECHLFPLLGFADIYIAPLSFDRATIYFTKYYTTPLLFTDFFLYYLVVLSLPIDSHGHFIPHAISMEMDAFLAWTANYVFGQAATAATICLADASFLFSAIIGLDEFDDATMLLPRPFFSFVFFTYTSPPLRVINNTFLADASIKHLFTASTTPRFI